MIMDNMEIVAKRQSKGFYLFYLIFGMVFTALGLFSILGIIAVSPRDSLVVSLISSSIPCLFCGVPFLVIGAVFVGQLSAQPENIIVREGNILHTPQGDIRIFDITNVYYRVWMRWTWWGPSSGTLLITAGMTEVKVRFVGNLEDVQRRIFQLVSESKTALAQASAQIMAQNMAKEMVQNNTQENTNGEDKND